MSPNQKIARRFFDEVCNGRKLDVADEIFAAEHVYHDPSSPGIGTGPDGMKQLIATYQKAFPDAHWSVDEMLESADRVITRWTGTGMHQGELAGLEPTGRPVIVAGIWIHRVSGSRIVESWNSWDTLGMFTQLGAVPKIGKSRAAQ